MTLSIGAITRDEIWLLSDRRISYQDKEPWDEATKVFELVATDGVMFVSYAGLGMTVGGMQPSEWLRNSLRNLKVTLDQALHFIANLIETEFARQLRTVAWASTKSTTGTRRGETVPISRRKGTSCRQPVGRFSS